MCCNNAPNSPAMVAWFAKASIFHSVNSAFSLYLPYPHITTSTHAPRRAPIHAQPTLPVNQIPNPAPAEEYALALHDTAAVQCYVFWPPQTQVRYSNGTMFDG